MLYKINKFFSMLYNMYQLYLYKRHLIKRIEKNNFGRRPEY